MDLLVSATDRRDGDLGEVSMQPRSLSKDLHDDFSGLQVGDNGSEEKRRIVPIVRQAPCPVVVTSS